MSTDDGSMAPVAVTAPSSRELNRWLNERRHHHPHVVAVDTPPADFVDLKQMCAALCDGLGKSTELWEGKSSTVETTRAWLSLGEIADALVIDAQLLRPRLLDEFVELAALHKVRVWLVIAGEHPGHVEVAVGRGGRVASIDELQDRFCDQAAASVVGGEPPVRLPRVQGWVFRSTCRDLLEPDEFENVDRRFCAEVRDLREQFHNLSGRLVSRQAVRIIRNRLLDAPDTDTMLLTAAAAQVAGITERFLVTVHLPTLLGAAETLPRVGRAVPERWWERLDTYRDPSVGAIAALYHLEIDPDQIRVVERTNVTARNTSGEITVTVNGVEHVIAGPAARFIEAQRVYRELVTSGDEHYLFSSHRPGKVGIRHINKQLLVPGAELGVAVAESPVRRKHPDPTRKLARYGVKVSRIERDPNLAKKAVS